ncbi:MAG TPA: SIS domain-containing protein [Solirubrobacteraceae bacterium]|nr:SIS domain-containing protein [Solirubrobacteraceae bacterium]
MNADGMNTDDLRAILDEHLDVATQLRETMLERIDAIASAITEALEAGNKLVTFGNGGSAADAQHFAAELIGHYQADRRSLPAVALTTDSSVLTAIANDYEYDEAFARQVRALVNPGDVVVAISTSGEAENVLRGVAAARDRGATTVAFTGSRGRLGQLTEHTLAVPSAATARIQEMHVLAIHLISERIDAWALHSGTPKTGEQ